MGEYDSDDQYTPAYTPRNREEPAWNHEPEAPHEAVHGLSTRRLSADSSFFQRVPLSHEEFPLPPTPPYSPFDTHPPSPSNERPPIKSAQTLEDFRNSLNAGLRNGRSKLSGLLQCPIKILILIFYFPLLKVDQLDYRQLRRHPGASGPSVQIFPSLVARVLKMFQKMNQVQAHPGISRVALPPNLHRVLVLVQHRALQALQAR